MSLSINGYTKNMHEWKELSGILSRFAGFVPCLINGFFSQLNNCQHSVVVDQISSCRNRLVRRFCELYYVVVVYYMQFVVLLHCTTTSSSKIKKVRIVQSINPTRSYVLVLSSGLVAKLKKRKTIKVADVWFVPFNEKYFLRSDEKIASHFVCTLGFLIIERSLINDQRSQNWNEINWAG